MKQLDLNIKQKAIDGTELEGETIGKALGQHLYNFCGTQQSIQKDSLKIHNWAIALFNGDTLKLDESDELRFKEIVTSMGFPVFFEAEILKALKDAKNDKN